MTVIYTLAVVYIIIGLLHIFVYSIVDGSTDEPDHLIGALFLWPVLLLVLISKFGGTIHDRINRPKPR